MDTTKVDMFIMFNAKYLPADKLHFIRDSLLMMDESRWPGLSLIQFKSPIAALLLSLFVGSYGVDRFYIGDTGMGVGKLLTCGGLGIWTIVDWFLIFRATKEKNLLNLQTYLS